jgi:hypothetical protein
VPILRSEEIHKKAEYPVSEYSWSVDADGVQRTIRVDYDWTAGRATIRVDGKMVVKPLTGEETERVVAVGSTNYIVRKLEDDSFDLDISAEPVLAPSMATSPGTKTLHNQPVVEEVSWKKRIGVAVGTVVVLAIVTLLGRFGWHGLQYMRIEWTPFAPEDRSFQAKFPGAPERQSESMNINGDMWNIVSYTKTYKDHAYAVQHMDLHMVITQRSAPAKIKRFVEDWTSALSGTIQSSEETTIAQNPALRFLVTVPAGTKIAEHEPLPVDAALRGTFVLRQKRLYLVWALSAAEDPFAKDIDEFLAAFQIEPPPQSDLGFTF